MPPELRDELTAGPDMFEAYKVHKKRFKEYDVSAMPSRVDDLVQKLQQCNQDCIVIVAHNITIGELTTRLGLRDSNERRRQLIIEKYGEKYGEGCWLSNCEVMPRRINWANVTLPSTNHPSHRDASKL